MGMLLSCPFKYPEELLRDIDATGRVPLSRDGG